MRKERVMLTIRMSREGSFSSMSHRNDRVRITTTLSTRTELDSAAQQLPCPLLRSHARSFGNACMTKTIIRFCYWVSTNPYVPLVEHRRRCKCPSPRSTPSRRSIAANVGWREHAASCVAYSIPNETHGPRNVGRMVFRCRNNT